MMKSSWETTKPRSKYHFRNDVIDPEFDKVIRLGKFKLDIADYVEQMVENAKPATWRTRGQIGKSRPEEELEAEDYDLERFGYGKDYQITHLNWDIPEVLQKVSKLFALDDCMNRIHVQKPGEVWNLHLDKLEKWNPNDPDSVIRIQVALTDWQPGQFWSYGNYQHSMWKVGEVTTFDWQNLPHSTANASHYSRVTFQITGVKTAQTELFLAELASVSEYEIR
jgi:hypothetical protein